LSKNAMRRHMNKGQLAMAVAQAKYSPANTLPHWGDETELAAQLGVSQPRLAKAIGVARYARELATKVIAGTLPLDDAYAAAVEAKRARKTAAEDADRYRVELEQLRAAAPDLAEQVEDHRLTLKEALVEQGERQRKAAEEAERERERRALSRRQLEQAVFFLDPRAMTPEELAGHLYAHLDGAPHEWERESLARCAEVLTALHRLTTATPSIPSTTTSPQED
jgi:hypothetical protein